MRYAHSLLKTRSLTDVPQSLEEQAKDAKERREQLEGYEKLIRAEKRAIQRDVSRIDKLFREKYDAGLTRRI